MRRFQFAALLAFFAGLLPFAGHAETIDNPDFQTTWEREDAPVAAGAANRTWLWGPEPFTTSLAEPYGAGQGETRTVQYFDKARMEINEPDAARDRWYVTTGLLALELMTGARQTGDNEFEQRGPANIPVAGDSDDAGGPTYASFNWLRGLTAFNTGTTLTATIDRAGNVGNDSAFARHAVLAEHFVPETGHTVASVFWEYLNSRGIVEENGSSVEGQLFEPWFYATGFPVTEAYWANVKVGGAQRDVLIQVFERRVLTYTPANDPAWRVELGNVGRHYYSWRYEREAQVPMAFGEPLWQPDLSTIADASSPDGSWQMGWSEENQSYVISGSGQLEAGTLRMISRHWDGIDGYGPLENYQVSVDIQSLAGGEAGIGVRVGAGEADNALESMVYFGVSAGGVRTVTFEDNTTNRTEYLLPPAAEIAAWDSVPGAWNTIAMSVYGNRVWVSVDGVVVGEAELPEEVRPSGGVALVVANTGSSGDTASFGFRNLTVYQVSGR